MKRILKIKNAVLGAQLLVVIGPYEWAEKWLRRYFKMPPGGESFLEKNFCGQVLAMSQESGVKADILWLAKYENCFSDYNTLVHEVSHVVDAVFDWKRIKPCTETRAYVTGDLFEKVLRGIRNCPEGSFDAGWGLQKRRKK